MVEFVVRSKGKDTSSGEEEENNGKIKYIASIINSAPMGEWPIQRDSKVEDLRVHECQQEGQKHLN